MNKAVLILGICVITAILISGVPHAVESATPTAQTLKASVRSYNESVSGSGELSYIGQREITSALPLVLEKILVSEGDTVNVGDTVAKVNRKSSAALIESLGKVQSLAISAADLSTAIALLPDTVTADCSGRVISTAQTGKAVQTGTGIVTLAPTDTLAVTAAISELDIAKVKIGQRVKYTPAAYPDEEFYGTVSAIASAARNQYNGAVLETVVDITVLPEKADERLRSGLTADIEIMLSDPRQILVLPYSAVGQDESGEFVYVYEDSRAVRHDISTGAEFSDGTEVISGISADDIIFGDPDEITGSSHIRIAKEPSA